MPPEQITVVSRCKWARGWGVEGEFVFVGAFAARVFVSEPLHIALFDPAFVHLGGVKVGVDDAVDLARLVDARGVDFHPACGGVAADEGCAAHVGDAGNRRFSPSFRF